MIMWASLFRCIIWVSHSRLAEDCLFFSVVVSKISICRFYCLSAFSDTCYAFVYSRSLQLTTTIWIVLRCFIRDQGFWTVVFCLIQRYFWIIHRWAIFVNMLNFSQLCHHLNKFFGKFAKNFVICWFIKTNLVQ